LEELRESWERLIEVAVRKNPFFDPDFLIPAIRHLGSGRVQVLAVDAPNRLWPEGPRVLCFLVPLIERRIYGIPLRCVEIWKHQHCYDCTPLLRKDCASEVLSFLLEYLGRNSRRHLLSLNTICGQGEFQQILTDVLFDTGLTAFHRDAFTRACFFPDESAQSYIDARFSKNTRKGTLRLERKLSSLGNLETKIISRDSSIHDWAEQFLTLESSGWKGTRGTSLSSTVAEASFFRELAAKSIAAGKMSLLKVEFSRKPIAMTCDLRQGSYGIAFKRAYDETLAEFSPGLIAEMKNIFRLHEDGIFELDSCAEPNHSMINRVWSGRTRFQSLVIALRRGIPRFAVASMPMMQLVGKQLNGQNKTSRRAQALEA
jgi:hypothetical protein